MTNSSNDNFVIKDGNNNGVTMRGKDISATGNGGIQVIRHYSTLYPVDYGFLGCDQTTVKSGIMAAGLAATSPIFAFRNTNAGVQSLIRKLIFNAWTLGTAFASGGLANFELYFARSFNVMDTGGSAANLNSPNGKLATFMGNVGSSIQYGVTGALTAGTRTLDLAPLRAINVVAPSTVNTPFFGSGLPLGATLFDKEGGNHPVLLAQYEGIVVQATVPGTGTWSYTLTAEWDEVPPQNY